MTRLDEVSAWLPLIGQDKLEYCDSLLILLLVFKQMDGQQVATVFVIPICRLLGFFLFFCRSVPGRFAGNFVSFPLFDRLVLYSRLMFGPPWNFNMHFFVLILCGRVLGLTISYFVFAKLAP
jgi:hypothetical protein